MQNRLEQRRDQGLLRRLKSQKSLIDFTSNDYFGFARTESSGSAPVGATGSRLLTGNHPLFAELEEKIAAFHRAESCLIFNSGYTANLGLLSAIGGPETRFIYDLDIHASMIDGMRLSEAKALPFRHNDLASLENRLKKNPHAYVLIESVYSISGDLAPLKEIVQLCKQYGASLIVDEAHATGIFGAHGEGRVVEENLESGVFARVHTFSKALGTHGGCVLGSALLKEYLVNFSRPFIYTTALPPQLLLLIDATYERLKKEAKMHQHRLRELLAYLGKSGHSPIQPIYIPEACEVASRLQEAGVDVRAILPPTTPKGRECLRIVLHSFNCEAEIDTLRELLVCV